MIIYIEPITECDSHSVEAAELPDTHLSNMIKVDDINQDSIKLLEERFVNETDVYIPRFDTQNVDRIFRILHYLNDLAEAKSISYQLRKYCSSDDRSKEESILSEVESSAMLAKTDS